MDRRHFITGLTAGVLCIEAARGHPQTALMPQLALFVPTPSGGGWDNIALAVDACLRDEGIVASTTLIHQPAGAAPGLIEFLDQYKGRSDVLMVSGAGMLGASIMARIPADLSHLMPLSRLTTEYMVICVAPDSAYLTLSDLIAALRRDPSRVPCSGGVRGSTDQVIAGLLAREAGMRGDRLVYRSYIGGIGAAGDVIGGSASFTSGGLSEMLPYISSGKLRPLAISSGQRLPGVGIPTCIEQGADIVLANWRGVFAPPDIRADEAALLRQVVERMTRTISWRAMLFEYNWTSFYQTGDAFTAFVREEMSRMRVLLAELGLT